MVSLFLFSKQVRGKYYYRPHCTDEEIGLRTIKELVSSARWQGSELSSFYFAIVSCFAYLTLSFLLWIQGFVNCGGTSLCILFCGKAYVRDSGSDSIVCHVV